MHVQAVNHMTQENIASQKYLRADMIASRYNLN